MPKLRNLGIIRSGFQPRGVLQNDPEGTIGVVQLGNARPPSPLKPGSAGLVYLAFDKRLRNVEFLEPNDILLRSRGGSYGAVLVEPDYEDSVFPAIAAAPLYILRLQTDIADPGYICWYINRPDVQRYLAVQAQGTSIVTVSLETFSELDIPLPPLSQQKQIGSLNQLLQKEDELGERLRTLRAELLTALLDQRFPPLPPLGARLQPNTLNQTKVSMTASTETTEPTETVDPLLPDVPPPTGDPAADAARRNKQKQVNDALWKACDAFRGLIDPENYKSYILPMLFIKYISDAYTETYARLMEKYNGNTVMVERQLQKDRFILPDGTTFADLYRQRHDDNIGEIIDIATRAIEDANPGKLNGVFRSVSYNDEKLGAARERNRRLGMLLENFADPRLDLRPSQVEEDIVGGGYMYLVERFAADSGKKAGEFFTPREVSILLARLVQPRPGDRICDPTCGSGSLLIRVADQIEGPAHEKHDYSLFGQEWNGSTYALCRMNMFLHREDSADIRWGDTLNNPQLLEGDALRRFNVVVANPPFSLDQWGAENAPHDRFRRFRRGVPPKSKGDYAFILHMIETALPFEGRVGVIVPHGVLFRGGSEGRIRQSLIEDNLLDTVVGLSEGLFFGTGIPAAILLFDRSREAGGPNESRKDVLFIDASREFAAGKSQNRLDPAHLDRIVQTHRERAEVARFSRRVPVAEIAENEFNLNIPRYIDTFEAKAAVDIPALQETIAGLESELGEVRKKLAGYLKELETAGL
jgi:type I restriction enzyme M protein